jgi:hypothetical protein
VQTFHKSAYGFHHKPIIVRQLLVEAGGVELRGGVENTQLADSAISLIAPIAWFARHDLSRFSPRTIPMRFLSFTA